MLSETTPSIGSQTLMREPCPVVVELREGSRMAEDLKQERNRLGNRVRGAVVAFLPADARADR